LIVRGQRRQWLAMYSILEAEDIEETDERELGMWAICVLIDTRHIGARLVAYFSPRQ